MPIKLTGVPTPRRVRLAFALSPFMVAGALPASAQDNVPPIRIGGPVEPVPASVAEATAPAPTAPESAPGPSLPPEVRAMIRRALDKGNEAEIGAVVKFARETLPAAAGLEIDAMLFPHRAEVAAVQAAYDAAQAVQSTRWTGRGELGGFRSTGTSDEIGVGISVRLSKAGPQWQHLIRASADYRRTNGATSRESLLLAYEPRYTFSKRSYSYGLAQAERDPFLGFDSRYTASAGLGYKLLDNPALKATIDTGPSLRFRDNSDGSHTTEAGIRASFDFGWKITPTLSLTQDTDGFAQNNGRSFTSLTALDAKVLTRLSTRFSYQMQYERTPFLFIDRFDTLSKVSVVYDF